MGVTWQRGTAIESARAGREVLLCGGSINSPQLLELSGIGQPDRLQALGIAVMHALPGVGENLQGHFVTRQSWRVRNALTYNERARGLGLVGEVARYLTRRDGTLALSVANLVGFARVRAGAHTPDVQYHMTPASFSATRERPLERQPGMTIAPCQLRPESRGSVHLKSAHPLAAPAIRQNFLASRSTVTPSSLP